MRKNKFSISAAVICGLLLSAAAPRAASREDKKTRLNVHERIRIPGAVLDPGEYVVQLVDTKTSNHVVRFSDPDETETIATVIAIPNKRAEVTGTTKFTFYETPVNEPPALRGWFYPGDRYGQEFAYPESDASKISEYSHRYVPSVPDDARAEDVTSDQVKSVAPDRSNSDLETGWMANDKADRRLYHSDDYMSSREVPESRLVTQVRKEIVTLPLYSVWDHIEYRVIDDMVVLEGRVNRPTLKSSAERVVERIEGVRTVENNIEVLPVSPNDDRIRRAVYYAIYGHSTLRPYQIRAVPPIHIIVENGNVTLEGAVANQMDKQIAGMQANAVNGVFSVDNNLQIG